MWERKRCEAKGERVKGQMMGDGKEIEKLGLAQGKAEDVADEGESRERALRCNPEIGEFC